MSKWKNSNGLNIITFHGERFINSITTSHFELRSWKDFD